ncbi:MAG: HEAT repeat domain-containing protein, partial [Candidatus Omnitrophica bacterium]|nr:HEAT repeat domain-containing protein [Candidatus Omnitrophota bacterium]
VLLELHPNLAREEFQSQYERLPEWVREKVDEDFAFHIFSRQGGLRVLLKKGTERRLESGVTQDSMGSGYEGLRSETQIHQRAFAGIYLEDHSLSAQNGNEETLTPDFHLSSAWVEGNTFSNWELHSESVSPIGNLDHMEPLLESLGNELTSARIAGALSLREMGESVTDPQNGPRRAQMIARCRTILQAKDWHQLQQRPDFQIFQNLNIPIEEAKRAAIAHLGDMGAWEELDLLFKFTEKLGKRYSKEVLAAIEKIAEARPERFKNKHLAKLINGRPDTDHVMIALGGRIMPRLLKIFDDPQSRRDVSDLLAKMGEPAFHALVNRLRHAKERDVREAILKILGQITQDQTTFEELLRGELLSWLGNEGWPEVEYYPDDPPHIVSGKASQRRLAAEALGTLGDRMAVRPLINLMKYDDDDDVRKAAAQALGQIGDPQAAPAFLDLLRDGATDIETKKKAIETLRKLDANAAQEEFQRQYRELPEWIQKRVEPDAVREIFFKQGTLRVLVKQGAERRTENFETSESHGNSYETGSWVTSVTRVHERVFAGVYLENLPSFVEYEDASVVGETSSSSFGGFGGGSSSETTYSEWEVHETTESEIENFGSTEGLGRWLGNKFITSISPEKDNKAIQMVIETLAQIGDAPAIIVLIDKYFQKRHMETTLLKKTLESIPLFQEILARIRAAVPDAKEEDTYYVALREIFRLRQEGYDFEIASFVPEVSHDEDIIAEEDQGDYSYDHWVVFVHAGERIGSRHIVDSPERIEIVRGKPLAESAPGGIALNIDQINLDVQSSRAPTVLPIREAIPDIELDGLTPFIIKITPLPTLAILLKD